MPGAWNARSPMILSLPLNFFEMEWPPNSGKTETFPEIDRIEYFPPFAANKKINPAQREFITRLMTKCMS